MPLEERCGRCRKPLKGVHTMSFFDTASICLPCEKKEQAHPDYPAAKAAEEAACRAGNYNFKGIGFPGWK